MRYHNELALTGQINDIGSFTRTNVDQSQRLGVELSGMAQPVKGLTVSANATFSQNKVKDFTSYVPDWDTGGQVEVHYSNTDLAFSPSIIAGGEVAFDFLNNGFSNHKNQNLTLALSGKYVGKQYLDNTSSDTRKMDGYFTSDLRLNYQLNNTFFKKLAFTFLVRNLFDAQYVSNGYMYQYYSNGTSHDSNAYYPQAGVNVMAGVVVGF
jgi:iron complex outermembrane receptor protein